MNKIKLADAKLSKDAQKKLETRKIFDQVLDNWAEQLEFYAIEAKATRAKYDAMIKEGFSKSEALEIVKAHKIF